MCNTIEASSPVDFYFQSLWNLPKDKEIMCEQAK